jgi:hypothetical protein
MAVTYPTGLPTAQIADYQLDIDYGVDAVVFEAGNRRQRKAFKQERMVFTMSLVLHYSDLWTWQSWANEYAYDWHWMPLESNYTSTTGKKLNQHYIRYISDLAIQSIDQQYFKVSLQAEMDLNTLPQGSVIYSGNWYVGGTPAAPSVNYLVGGTPAAPKTDFVIAGTPDAPAA